MRIWLKLKSQKSLMKSNYNLYDVYNVYEIGLQYGSKESDTPLKCFLSCYSTNNDIYPGKYDFYNKTCYIF